MTQQKAPVKKEHPLMTYESAVKYRQDLIDRKVITPDPDGFEYPWAPYDYFERPAMNFDKVVSLRERLIKAGVIKQTARSESRWLRQNGIVNTRVLTAH